MESMVACRFESAIGPLLIAQRGGFLCRILLPNRAREEHGIPLGDTPLLWEAKNQIQAYFAGTRHEFSLPLHFESGTEFRRRVWEAMCRIPYGETATYADMALLAGSPRACRAAGGACHANPLAIVVPCHRVVGTNGSLTGYGGGLELKKYLLALERNNKPAASR